MKNSSLFVCSFFICILIVHAAASGQVQVTVTSPTAGTGLSSPVQFAATATSTNPITGFVVYANDQNIYLANNSSLNATVALGSGTYKIYIRAWDSSGAFGTSSPFTITVGTPPTPNVQVTVQTPSGCNTVGSPVQFMATATSGNPITGFVIYADDQDVYQTNASSLNTAVALSPGTYSVYVRAWDATGAFGTSPTFSLTVGTTAAGVKVAVKSPNVGASLGSPVQFAATATSVNPITGFVVYANDQNVYQTNSSGLNASVPLSAGTYNIYVRAWDSTGAYGTSAPFLTTVSPSHNGMSVTVNSPISSTVQVSPVQFTATAASANPITGFVVYANDQNVYQTNSSTLNANVNFPVGAYNMYIRAWDSSGAYATSANFPMTVSSATLPTPPSNALVFAGLQDLGSGWGSCGTRCCAGGAADSLSWPMNQFQSTPSLDGASAEFSLSGPPYADALHWYKTSPENGATNYLWDFWTYLDAPSLSAQAIEFDTFSVVPIGGVNRKFMFGSQCNYVEGLWDGWMEDTSGGGAWVPTNIPCTTFSPGSWHHVVWYVKRVGATLDQLQYVSLTVDGSTQSVNLLQRSQATNWDQVLGVQYQQDLGPTGTSFDQWVDSVTLTVW